MIRVLCVICGEVGLSVRADYVFSISLYARDHSSPFIKPTVKLYYVPGGVLQRTTQPLYLDYELYF